MIFESENGFRSIVKDELSLENNLRTLDGVANSYAILEHTSGSYMQAGGGPSEYTIESRKYFANGGFSHWKAKQKGNDDGFTTRLIISKNNVTVQSNQLISLDLVIRLFKQYLKGEDLPLEVDWDNITEMFDMYM